MRIVGNPPSGGKQPTTPTIGTATDDGTGTGVSVAFTPSTYIGKGTITYTATSSPGSLTGTGLGSPITVSGLTTGTAYTFTVKGDTNYGVASDNSAASNSVTPTLPTSFESIATATGTGSSNTITFTSIPSTYKHLQLRWNAKGTTAVANKTTLSVYYNNDTTSTMRLHYLNGNGTSTGVGSSLATDLLGAIPLSGTGLTNMTGVGVLDLIDYASTTKNKVTRTIYGYDTNGTIAGQINLASMATFPTTITAVNRIDLVINSGSFTTSTTFALYGIKG